MMRVHQAHPPIVVTKSDYDRLFNLADSPLVSPTVGDYLMDELQRARVVAPEEVAATVVTMRSSFIFKDESTAESRIASLVFPGGENIDEGCISVVTPVGAALLGLSEGQSIAFETRTGESRVLTLVRVLSQNLTLSGARA
jgi:regulator of nucleoside diphosphate kinase